MDPIYDKTFEKVLDKALDFLARNKSWHNYKQVADAISESLTSVDKALFQLDAYRYADSGRGRDNYMYYRITKVGIDHLNDGGFTGSWIRQGKPEYHVTINEAPRNFTHYGDTHGGVHLPFSDTRHMKLKTSDGPSVKETKHHPIMAWLAKHWWQVAIPLLIGLALLWAEKNWGVIESIITPA